MVKGMVKGKYMIKIIKLNMMGNLLIINMREKEQNIMKMVNISLGNS